MANIKRTCQRLRVTPIGMHIYLAVSSAISLIRPYDKTASQPRPLSIFSVSDPVVTYEQLKRNAIFGTWLSKKPVSENPGGLKGSTQHWPAVYSQEFQNPRSLA